MGKKNKQKRKWNQKFEQRSDKRTAEFVVRRIDEIQEHLGDLIPELRTFEHHCEVVMIDCCVSYLQRLKKKYQKFVDNGVWED